MPEEIHLGIQTQDVARVVVSAEVIHIGQKELLSCSWTYDTVHGKPIFSLKCTNSLCLIIARRGSRDFQKGLTSGGPYGGQHGPYFTSVPAIAPKGIRVQVFPFCSISSQKCIDRHRAATTELFVVLVIPGRICMSEDRCRTQ